jgi:hypothetical protein
VNKFPGVSLNRVCSLGTKNIMTGANVALTMAGDSFVADQIDNSLTASPSEVPEIARIFFTTAFVAPERDTQ